MTTTTPEPDLEDADLDALFSQDWFSDLWDGDQAAVAAGTLPPLDLTGFSVEAIEWAARAFDPLPDAGPAWRDVARPEQLAPPGTWLVWLILAGRGWGKTRTGAEWCYELATRYPGARIALVAPTIADARDTMVEGESGLLEVIPDRELRGRARETGWNRSLGELYLANGSRFKTFSSERPARLRGPQFHAAWGDEPAQWEDAWKGVDKDTTWSNLLFTLRLPPRPGWPSGFHPQVVLTTTPRFLPLLKVSAATLVREPHKAGLMQRETTHITSGRTSENLANLDETYRRNVIDPLTGTRLAAQELDAQMLEDVEGAFLDQTTIDRGRRAIGEVPHLVQVAIGVDPATTTTATSDETGLIACGVDAEGHGYVLDDRSDVHRPEEWGRAAWELAFEWGAGVIVIEDNQGGDMVVSVLLGAWDDAAAARRAAGLEVPPIPVIARVHPTGKGEGKWARAMPLQLLYDKTRIHHVTTGGNDLRFLEDQAVAWTGDKDQDSPDRVDALVHALTWLMFPAQRKKTKKAGATRTPATDKRFRRAGRR